MGLFDNVLGALEAAVEPGSTAGATMPPGAGNLLGELLNQAGGVSGVMDKLNQAGLGEKVNSWIGSNPNIPLAAHEVLQVFPQDQLEQLAEKHGVPTGMVAGVLAQLLPHAVNQSVAPDAGPPAQAAADQGWA